MKMTVVSVAGEALLALADYYKHLSKTVPGKELSLSVYFVSADRLNISKQQMLRDIENADFALIDLMGAPEGIINEVGRALERCRGHRVIIGYGCRDKLRLGKFSMSPMMSSKEDPGPNGKGGLGTMSKMRKMAAGMGKVLPVPMMKDMNNVFLLGDYWQSGTPEDIASMMSLILRDYYGWKELPKPQPPRLRNGIYPLEEPARGAGKPLIAFLVYGHKYPNDLAPVWQEAKRQFEPFADILPIAFSNQLDKDLNILRDLLTREPVSMVVNFMPFRVGAGPMGGDAEAGVALLKDLKVPLLEPFYISKQSAEEWASNEKGASPGEFLISIMLPELDGGIETCPVAVMGETRKIPELNLELTSAVPLPGAIEQLAARAQRWLALQEKPVQEKRIALISYNYPPGEEHLFSAAFLDVFQSLEVLLRALKLAGYQTEILSAEELEERFLSEGILNGSRYGSVSDTPGIVLGNVFLGVQPFRAANNTSTVYHDKHLPPPEDYVEFYRYLREDFRADAFIHIGTHGTLEFLPGKESGLVPEDWAGQLLGDVPHFYYYYCGNSSEGMTAKRRSNAVLVTYAPPAFEQCKLYGDYAELDALQTECSEAEALSPARVADLKQKISELAASLGLPEEGEALEEELYRMRQSLIPHGLHVMNAGESAGLLRALEGVYVPVGPMGDTHKNPDILPAGRNGVAFDPRFIPSKAAYEKGAEIARAAMERYRQQNGSWPRRTALVLWGMETTQTQGETVGQLMYYLGLRMDWKGTSFLSRIEVIPTEEMDRPRLDVTVSICGFFRDLFPLLLQNLNAALRELSELNETDEQSAFAAETRARYDRFLAQGMPEERAAELARARFFGPADGEYGSNLTELVGSGQWKDERELGNLFTAELGYLYGESLQGERIPEALEYAFSGVQMVTQVRNNADYEISDLDHYYEFFGGLTKAVETYDGTAPASFVVDTTGDRVYADTAEEAAGRGIRTRLLNPRWIDGMLDHKFHGGQKIADRFENVLGLSATLDCVPSETYDKIEEVYVEDEELQKRIKENNPYAYLSALEKLLEAERRGYWEASEEKKDAVLQAYLNTEGDVEDEL